VHSAQLLSRFNLSVAYIVYMIYVLSQPLFCSNITETGFF